MYKVDNQIEGKISEHTSLAQAMLTVEERFIVATRGYGLVNMINGRALNVAMTDNRGLCLEITLHNR